jgi:diguanylate cyclase (GGDEF)-like protein/PAS domain S-box-containing protein
LKMTVQSNAEEKKILEKIVAASAEFLQSADGETDYQKITDTVLDISGAKFAAFNLYNEDGSKFTTIAISGSKENIKKASFLLGFRLRGKIWNSDPVSAERMKSNPTVHISSISEYMKDFMPKPAASLLGKTLKMGEVVLVRILKENTMIGYFTLVMPKNVKFKNENYTEIYASQLGLFITRIRGEAKLSESEIRLRSVFDSVGDPLFLLDQKTGAILDVNDAACRIYGYSRNEMLELRIMDISAESKETRKALDKFLAFVPVRYHKKKDGSKFPVEITASLIDLNGRKVITTSMRDITERMLSEKALRKSEEKFSKAFHSGAVLMSISTVEDGRIIDVNDAFLKTLGFSRGEVIGKTSNDLGIFVDKGQRAELKKIFDEKGRVSNLEVLVKGRDGIVHTGIFTIDPIDIGEKTCWLTNMTDITERKKAEAVLIESERRYRNLFMSSRDAVLILEPPSWNFTSCNISTLKIFKVKSEAELFSYGLVKLFAEFQPDGQNSGEKAREIIDVTLRKGSNFFEWVYKRPNGEEFIAEVMLSKVEYGGKVLLQATLRDITERKKAYDLLQTERERLANVIEGTNVGTWEWNIQKKEIILNAPGDEFIGYKLAEISPINMKTWEGFIHPDDIKNANMELSKVFAKEIDYFDVEVRLKHKDGNWVWQQDKGKVISWTTEGKPHMMSGMYIDITERKKTEEEIIHLSFHDYLTGLYNRRFFEEELKRLDTDRQLPLSFIMGDLNSLKIINDVFGHNEGDRLLKETAEVLKTVCRSDDILARWGGDEFVILLPKTSISESEEIVLRIKKECEKTKSQRLPVSIALGVATKEKAGQDIQSIVMDAESNMYKNKLAQKESLTSSIIFALEQALFEKSSETKEHTDRMHEMAIKLGKSIKLPAHLLDELSLLASLHDIGKVAIPEKILLKKGKLTEKEWNIIKRHPEIGFNIAQSSPQIAHIAKSILSCHENFDGSGYPMGLKEQEIPVISRIILIVDAYDVMTSGRVYKEAMSKEEAIAELKRCAGTQFDPELIEKFVEILAN